MREQTDEEKDQMLQELLDVLKHHHREEYPQPNLTAGEYAELAGVTRGAAYRRLESKVESGELKKQCDVIIDEHACCIYWKA